MPALVGIAILFYFLMVRPQGAERRRREEMLKNLRKNDRVVTIGGIHGVVANIQPDSDEVILKVDETTNTKLRMSRSSIHLVITDESADGALSK